MDHVPTRPLPIIPARDPSGRDPRQSPRRKQPMARISLGGWNAQEPTGRGEFCLTVGISEASVLPREAHRRQEMGHKGPHRLVQRSRDHLGARALSHLKHALI